MLKDPFQRLNLDREVLTVSQLNGRARLLLEDVFAQVWVEGEISNLARPASGHIYFTLKDKNAQVRCALFRQNAARVRQALRDGLAVRVRGKVSLFEGRGDYQLILDTLEPAGDGALRLAFKYPERYAAAVSFSGAVVEDHLQNEPVSETQIKLFRGAFGKPFKPEAFNRENVFAFIPTLKAAEKKPRILLTVGDDDYFKLYEGAFLTFLRLRAENIPVELRVTDGNHSWPLWNRELERGLRVIDAAFAGR